MIGRRHSGARVIDNDLYIFGGNQSASESVLSSLQYADISEIVNAVGDYKDNQAILSYNYPNPFNQSTSIIFSLKSAGVISVKVYDQLGREVKTLVNEYMLAGEHQVQFNGSNLSSGIYFYKIQAGEFSGVKKMLLLKR